MSDNSTKTMIRAYEYDAPVNLFLSGMFDSPEGNFYDSETVEIDIRGGKQEVSVVVANAHSGYNMNEDNLYTNKKFVPPVHAEAISLTSEDLIKRDWGQNPFANKDFRRLVVDKMFSGMKKGQEKIQRSNELQAAQIMQTGVVDLKNSAGVTLYTIDFGISSGQFINAGTVWSDSANADPAADIDTIGNVIRNGFQGTPDTVIMGSTAWTEFTECTKIKDKLDLLRSDTGVIKPLEMRGNGGTFRGRMDFGAYAYDIWTYEGTYADPNGGAITPYLDPGKVIVRASTARFDATFGAVHNIGRVIGTNPILIPELPTRFTSQSGGFDLFTNVWATPDGEQLFGGVKSRPLLMPTAGKSFGCITT